MKIFLELLRATSSGNEYSRTCNKLHPSILCNQQQAKVDWMVRVGEQIPPGRGAAFQCSTSHAESHRTDRENLIILQKIQLYQGFLGKTFPLTHLINETVQLVIDSITHCKPSSLCQRLNNAITIKYDNLFQRVYSPHTCVASVELDFFTVFREFLPWKFYNTS